jgi:AAA+ superfamily predicted ATPase
MALTQAVRDPTPAVNRPEITAWEPGEPLPSLERLASTFHLTNFEKMILVLCAGPEIDGEIALQFAKLHMDSRAKFPTFDIALRVFPDADWAAIMPDSNLRHYQLISVQSSENSSLLTSQIRIPERILHFLLGFNSTTDTIIDYLVTRANVTAPLAPSHRKHVMHIKEICEKHPRMAQLPAFVLQSQDITNSLIVAQNVCQDMGLGLFRIPGDTIPTKASDEKILSGILSRECFLAGNALFMDAFDVDEPTKKTIARFAGRTTVPLMFIGSRDSKSFSFDKPVRFIELKRPTKQEQREMWRECLKENLPNEDVRLLYISQIDKIASAFNLDAVSIEGISKKIAEKQSSKKGYDPLLLPSLLQNSTYNLTKNRLGDLAEEIIAVAKMDDIILPSSRKQILKTISHHFKNRHKVYDEWGFARKLNRGLGIVALFAGESGTGKTMAAEAIANELGTDIYRIDLSMIASKYIGETEKNLKQIFDAAETKECILFFDEADTLFGKRSEVKDSHDRYANLQVGYLLQRIESYDGIAILATNFKKSLDSAFVRRIRFIVDFPFPDEYSREQIWRRIFPPSVPLDNLDYEFLARLAITGGNIRNIALNAAFLAVEEGTKVSMSQIKRAAEEEYAKLGRTMTTAEVGNWP